jgi:hypothetical protein
MIAASPRRALMALVVLPVLFVAVLFWMRAASLPFWQVFNLDPDYYYLLNGLRLVEGLAPVDVSHPGTPVQVFIALVLWLMHAGAAPAEIVAQVLADPESHLVVVTGALYPLVGLALLGLGVAVWRAWGLLPALLAQSSPFLSMIIAKFGLHPKPEPFLVACACLIVAASVSGMTADRRPMLWRGVLPGLVVGFAIACKIQALALGLVPLFLLVGGRERLVYGGAVIGGFALFTLPAWPSAPLWIDWMGRIVLHSGAYGSGAATLVDPARYPRAVLGLFGSKLIFSLGLLVSLGVLAALWRRWAGEPRLRLLAGLAGAQILTVLLVAKQAAAHYMVPALMLTGPALAVVCSLSVTWGGGRWHRPAWIAVGLLLVGLTAPAVIRQHAELAGWTQAGQSIDMARFQGCAMIDYDSSSSPSYALLRGDLNAQGRYSAQLERIMPPDTYAWFINDHTWWARGFMRWGQRMEITDIAGRYPCLVLRGSQSYTALPTALAQIQGFRLDDRCELGEESVLTMGITCAGTSPAGLAK